MEYAPYQVISERPVKDIQNVFGRQERTSWESGTTRIDADSNLRPKKFEGKHRHPFSGQLPYSSLGYEPSAGQVPFELTQSSRVEIHKAENNVPFYERYWPILKQPGINDITVDPKYHMQNTRNLPHYQKLTSENGPSVKTIHPTYGLNK